MASADALSAINQAVVAHGPGEEGMLPASSGGAAPNGYEPPALSQGAVSPVLIEQPASSRGSVSAVLASGTFGAPASSRPAPMEISPPTPQPTVVLTPEMQELIDV